MSDPTHHPIHHEPEANRFETTVDGETCLLDYRLDGQVMTMTRVYVPPPVEGRGIASRLTRFALDHCREHGLSVVPRCPYVAAWIKRHDDYEDLLTQE
ncbi:N-acetyltransferase [Wenzhouxiangella sp. XN79A]|uniref:GNAT family N-acetyltransferase n=1 Tax=Wenzhouxiangella sp. XN79A TaxID=2724193 RepID=UPI00144AA4DB|nr:GNAT family N-acetyltransferase [Wenzhouxiangella sp. XN79A]NKI34695.1 N-acetyltransferase [Wenzhouxiangella sp. XN79A]